MLTKGFTLLEMLVVLVIIGLLAGLVAPQFLGEIDNAKRQTAEAQIKMLKNSISALYLDIGRYPTSEEGLKLLSSPPMDENSKPFWKGPYLDEDLPLDPWNTAYQYSVPGKNGRPFALYSLGADKQLGGTDNNEDIGYLPPQ